MPTTAKRYDQRLSRIVGLSYLLLLLPLITEVLEDGHLPHTPRALITDVVLTLLIAAFIHLLQEARAELKRRDALRHDIIQTVLHDLKTPITTSIGSLSALLEPRVGKLSENQLLEMALRGCRAQAVLVDDMMDADQLETSELLLRPTPTPLGALFQKARDLVEAYALRNHVQIRWPGPGLTAVVRLDERLIKRVIVNLVQNAVKYSPPDGTILVETRIEDADFLLSVRDSGSGIPPEHLSRLFQKFHRVEGLDQTGRKGMGLGLYFCRLTVEAHKGRIFVANAAGGGAVFSVRLPGVVLRGASSADAKEGRPCPIPETRKTA